MYKQTNWQTVYGMFAFLAALVLLSACSDAEAPTKVEPAEVREISDSDLSQIILTDAAITRLGIETLNIQTEEVIRTRTVGGRVESRSDMANSEDSDDGGEANSGSDTWIRVPLSADEIVEINQERPAIIRSLDNVNSDEGLMGELMNDIAMNGPDDTFLAYEVTDADHDLIVGQRVSIELALNDEGGIRQLIPYSAVIYDTVGNTWVYTNGEPATYTRHAIDIDYIDDDVAIIFENLPPDIAVVSIGAAELYGTEFGVGK